jgi:hypothetical protein
MLEGISFNVGEPELPDRNLPVLKLFDPGVIDLLSELSAAILAVPGNRSFPDLIALGFWSRRAALTKAQEVYCDGLALGRGVAFHVAPANVPLMFAYSLMIGLLSGNANIVRLPSKPSRQGDFVCYELRRLLADQRYQHLAPYALCVSYDHAACDASRIFSGLCDVRVIWGGDATIERIRQEPLKASAIDIVFFDRYSLAVIDSEAWLAANDKPRLIKGFYNDAFVSDQLACSAPRYVIWTGGRVNEAREDFWSLLHAEVEARYPLKEAIAVAKWEHLCRLGANTPGLSLQSHDNHIVRLWSEEIRPALVANHPGGGLFVESRAEQLEDCAPLFERGCQTLTYYGVSRQSIRDLLARLRPRGVDRVVPIGQALDFSLVWDGYDTVRALSRKIVVA